MSILLWPAHAPDWNEMSLIMDSSNITMSYVRLYLFSYQNFFRETALTFISINCCDNKIVTPRE